MIHSSQSLTHDHILSVILSSLNESDITDFTILDVGCGNGLLIYYIYKNLCELYPHREIRVFGFDVGDHSVQREGFFDETLKKLSEFEPNYDWESSLSLIRQDDPWPYDDESFDFIISNQVLEHVITPESFFSEIKRCLKKDGSSIHLFPVKECILDGHIFIPYAHRFNNPKILKYWIFAMCLLGFGSYWNLRKLNNKAFSFANLMEWSDQEANHMIRSCHYIWLKDLKKVSKKTGFDFDFKYTDKFYLRKLYQLMGKTYTYHFGSTFKVCDSFKLHFYKYLNGVTLRLTKSKLEL